MRRNRILSFALSAGEGFGNVYKYISYRIKSIVLYY